MAPSAPSPASRRSAPLARAIRLLEHLRHFTRLPREIAPFEHGYVARTNRLAVQLLAATVPCLAAVAWWSGADVLTVVAVALLVLAASVAARRYLRSPRQLATLSAVAAVVMGSTLVYAGPARYEGELHFQFFVVLATLAVYGNPRVVLVGSAAIVLDHGIRWGLSVAGGRDAGEASVVLALHVVFIALATIGTCFIARVFYDNVLRLERKVDERTRQAEQRQRDVRLLLDNAHQAFLVIDADGAITGERSAAIDGWFGAPPPGATWFDALRGVSPDLAEMTRAAWLAVVDDFLPRELTLGQMPSRVQVGASTLRVEYRIVSPEGAPLRALVVVEDVSRAVAEEALRADREEDLLLLSGLLDDRAWMMGFLDEVEAFVREVERERLDGVEVARALHTLKGNARMTGFVGLAALCHDVEERLAAEARPASSTLLDPVAARARRLVRRGRTMLDAGRAPSGARSIRSRLERIREHARRAATEAGKEVDVVIDDCGLQLDLDGWSPILSNLVHGIQNAIDHGIEPAEERLSAGKPRRGLLVVRTHEERDRVVLEVEDDGRGPRWTDIARRARALGLPTDTGEQLIDAVFHDGFTTADRVSETSGRGIGLAALRAAVDALGGAITLRGQAGRGATLRIVVPRAAAHRRRRSSGSLRSIDMNQRASR